MEHITFVGLDVTSGKDRWRSPSLIAAVKSASWARSRHPGADVSLGQAAEAAASTAQLAMKPDRAATASIDCERARPGLQNLPYTTARAQRPYEGRPLMGSAGPGARRADHPIPIPLQRRAAEADRYRTQGPTKRCGELGRGGALFQRRRDGRPRGPSARQRAPCPLAAVWPARCRWLAS
jgi:hypothetical protein